MASKQFKDDWYDIDQGSYDWSARFFRLIKKMLNVHMKLHADEQVYQGDIFLFNHFSRFETFIPQYLIYEKTGHQCWSIASSEFFTEDTVLAKYLSNMGVIPHDHQRLFPILAEQILHGRKVIIFPEGGMVKDRRVMDKRGRYSIYSRIRGERRKHHTGPAVLAQGIEAFKATIRNAYADKKIDQLLKWKEDLGFENLDQLLIAAIKPTWLVPSNITFYPIRSSDNLLIQSVRLFSNGLSLRQTEELLVEGNIMLKDTDMDIRMGEPIDPYHVWHWWNHDLLELVSSEFGTLDEVFALHDKPNTWKQKLLGAYFKKNAKATRNQYMKDMYSYVTVNLCHLASYLIMYCISKKMHKIEKRLFYRTLYVAIKLLQKKPTVHLQRHLQSPEHYEGILCGENKLFAHFICVAKESHLLSEEHDEYHFLSKLCEEHDFDTIRMENVIAVYHNEIRPISAVTDTVIKAHKQAKKNDPVKMSEHFLDDETLLLQVDKKIYSKPEYDDINSQETASCDARPFLLHPKKANGCGALLIHGLLSSPAELRDYGEHLVSQGFTVYGLRIKGHGTSPYDLRQQALEDWYDSVNRGFEVLELLCQKIILVGFSTGGALALKYATELKEHVTGVIAVAVPYEFVDSSLMMVPWVHGANKVVQWISSYEGVKPFIFNEAEHPHINYRAVPIRGLYELRRLIQEMDEVLPLIESPVLLVYADEDPIVSLNSSKFIFDKLTTPQKQLRVIHSQRHGILNENSDDIWTVIDGFINNLCVHQSFCKPNNVTDSKHLLPEPTQSIDSSG